MREVAGLSVVLRVVVLLLATSHVVRGQHRGVAHGTTVRRVISTAMSLLPSTGSLKEQEHLHTLLLCFIVQIHDVPDCASTTYMQLEDNNKIIYLSHSKFVPRGSVRVSNVVHWRQ